MLSTRKAATGRTVYPGGSFAPHTGQVSAQGTQGYINRGMRQKAAQRSVSAFGADGKSNTRSGLAQKALARNSSPAGRPANSAVAPTPTPPAGSEIGQNQGPDSQAPAPAPAPAPNVDPVTGLPVSITIGPTGTLELPYSSAWSAALLDSLEQANAGLLELQGEQQQQALSYAASRRNAGLEYDDTKRATLNNSAGAGTAFSSGYGLAVGNNANAYNNEVNDMDVANSAFGNSIAAKRAAIQSGFNQQLQKAVLDYAADLADNAGNLGLGVTPAPNGPNGGGGGGANGSGQGWGGGGNGGPGSGQGWGGNKPNKGKPGKGKPGDKKNGPGTGPGGGRTHGGKQSQQQSKPGPRKTQQLAKKAIAKSRKGK